MDQVKIGSFIKECRKAKNMTQEDLAKILFVLPKTISKWETGHGMPDVSVMYPLCNALDISLNELFLGTHLDNKDISSEENNKILLEFCMKEKETNKRIMIGEIILGICFIILDLGLILIAGLLDIPTVARIAIIIAAVILLVVGLTGLIILDCHIGYFECPHCHERFIPKMSSYIFGIHTMTKRRLKCPKCGKKSWCCKRIARKEDK